MVSASAKMWICTDHQVDGYIPDEASSEAYFDQILKLLDLRVYCGQLNCPILKVSFPVCFVFEHKTETFLP